MHGWLILSQFEFYASVLSILFKNSLHDRLPVLGVILRLRVRMDLGVRRRWRVSSDDSTAYGSRHLIPHRTRLAGEIRTWTLCCHYNLFVPAVEVGWWSVSQVRFDLLNSHWRRLAVEFVKSLGLHHLEPLVTHILVPRVATHDLLEEWVLVLAGTLVFDEVIHRWGVGYHLPRRVTADHTLRHTVTLRCLHVVRRLTELHLV